MRNCDTLQEDLKAYQDGQLPPLPRLRVRLHLKRCESCRKEIDEMGRIGRELHNMDLDSDRLEPSLRARILASIPDGLPDPPDPAVTPAWRRKPTMVWGSLAAAALALVFFYPTLRKSDTPGSLQEKFASMAPQSAGRPPSASAPAPSTEDFEKAGAQKAGAPPDSDNIAPGGSPKSAAAPSTGSPPANDSASASSNMDGGRLATAPPFAPDANAPSKTSAPGSLQFGDGHTKEEVKSPSRGQVSHAAAPAPPSPSQNDLDSGFTAGNRGTARYSEPQAPTSTTTNGGSSAGAASPTPNVASALTPAAALPTIQSTPKADTETSLLFLVQDIPDSSKQVTQIAKDAGGQTVPAPVSSGLKSKTVLLNVEVPVAKFDAVVHRLSQLNGLQRNQKINLYEEAQRAAKATPRPNPSASMPSQPQKHSRGSSAPGGNQSVTNMGTNTPYKPEAGGTSAKPVVPLQPLTTPSKTQKTPPQSRDRAPVFSSRMPADTLQRPPAMPPTTRTKAELAKKSKPASRGVIHIELKEAPKSP